MRCMLCSGWGGVARREGKAWYGTVCGPLEAAGPVAGELFGGQEGRLHSEPYLDHLPSPGPANTHMQTSPFPLPPSPPLPPPPQVIKLISQVIADFADGEISQAAKLFDTNITLEAYLEKSFYKTASLIAAACRCAAVFSDCSPEGELWEGQGGAVELGGGRAGG